MENMILCQSCAMPLNNPEDYGTEKDGSKSADYCQYCRKDGAFVGGDQTMEEAIESCIPFVLEHYNGDADRARAEMMQFYPTLKRWAKQ